MEFDELELLGEARSKLKASKTDQMLIDDDVLICECMCISAGTIRETLLEKEMDLSILSNELGLGSACSSCLKNFDQWKDGIK